MKQEKIDKLMNEIDKKCKLPKHWDEFLVNNSKRHHIIIKNQEQKNLYCTNCEKYFVDKTIKVRDYVKCPHCHEKSKVYGIRYDKTSFEQSVILVQRMNKQVIIRIFEIYTYFETDTKETKTHTIEYARILPGVGRFIGNNVYITMFGSFQIYHGHKKLNWHTYKGHKNLTDFPTYPYNKKRLIKGTIMEYAPINEFLDRFSYYRYNFLDVLELAAYGSFEMLWNMKLYNLSFYSKALNKKNNCSFYKRFGVPKNFLKFMQDNDISYKELLLLRLFQKADSKLLQKYRYDNISYVKFLIQNNILEDFNNLNLILDINTVRKLKEISQFVSLKSLMNYPKGLNNLNIYNDYLNMAKNLSLNYKSKKDLFPRNLISRHDKLQAKIKITEDMNTQFAAYLRYLELSKYTYSNNKYIIFPAPSIDSMKDEGKQQENCVGHLYLTPYVEGKTEIFFVRQLENICTSFITLEYKNGKIVQKELPHHKINFNKDQLKFIDNWIAFRQSVDKKQSSQKKSHINIQKYDLTHMVA